MQGNFPCPMHYFLSLLWAGGWTRWPTKVPTKAVLWFCHPCHIPLVLVLPSSRNPLHRAPSCYLHKVASATSCVSICSWIWQHRIQDTNPNSTFSLSTIAALCMHILPIPFFLHLPVSWNILFKLCLHNLLSSFLWIFPCPATLYLFFPSNFHKVLLRLPLCLSYQMTITHWMSVFLIEWQSLIHSVWTGFCFSSPKHQLPSP